MIQKRRWKLAARVVGSLLLCLLYACYRRPPDEIPPRRSPVKQCWNELFITSVALQAYRDDHGMYPITPPTTGKELDHRSWLDINAGLLPAAWPIRTIDTLSLIESELTPRYLRTADWDDTDIWGNPVLYKATQDGKHFTLVSLGMDGKFDRKFQGYVWKWSEWNNDMIVTENGLVSGPGGLTR